MNNLEKTQLNRIVLLLCLLAESITINLIIVYGVIPVYHPDMFFRFSTQGIPVSILAILAYTWMPPKDLTKLSTWAYLILVLALGVPSISMHLLMDRNVGYLFLVLASFAIIAVILRLRINTRQFRIKNVRYMLIGLLALYVLISLYLIVKRGGIDSRAFDFSDIYELRAENNITGFDGYMKNWCVKMLFPFFFLYFLERKKYLQCVGCLALQLLLYLSFGEKTTLFSIPLVIAIYYVFRSKKVWFMYVGFCVVMLVPLIIYVVSGEYDWLASLSSRFCYIPSVIGYNYYDFFAEGHPHLWLSETIFGRMLGIASPYPTIFSYYIADGGMANAGFVADAYANGGVFFCVLFSAVLGFVLRFYDAVVKNKKHKNVIMGVLGYSCINLMDGGLLMTLLTGGMLLTLFVAMTLPEESATAGDAAAERLQVAEQKTRWIRKG